MSKEIRELLEKAQEVLSWCQENADEKWMVAHLALIRTDIDQALALSKQQPPAGEYPDSEFTRVQRKAVRLAAEAYEEDQEWCPTKTSRLLEACAIIDKAEASKAELIALIWKQNPKHRHDHDYFHDNCTLCGMEKLRYEKLEAAIITLI